MAFLDFWSTPEFLEKSVIRQVNASEFLLDPLTRQCFPMRVRRAFQLGYMQTHCLVARIRESIFIALTLPRVEILVNLPHIVKQVPNADSIRLIIKADIYRFSWTIRYQAFIPYRVDRQTRHQAATLCMSANLIL